MNIIDILSALPGADQDRIAQYLLSLKSTPRELPSRGHVLQALELECGRLNVSMRDLIDQAIKDGFLDD